MKTDYIAAPTVAGYIEDRKHFVNIIIGPIGSGKTLGSIIRFQVLAHEQLPGKDGMRRTRIAVIRNTYSELRNTTIQSFTGYFGTALTMNWGNMTAIYRNGDVEAEVVFLSLDKPNDMGKLLSLEISFCYLNELRELPEEALTNVTSRLGRYPPVNSGVECTHPCAFADSNAFDNEHWLYEKMFADRPRNHKLWLQPPAVLEDGSINPKAENLENLPKEYYGDFLLGKPTDWIDVMVKVKFIPLNHGLAVYPEYNDHLHTIDQHSLTPPDIDREIVCGVDNGRTSGICFGQVDGLGRLVIFDELVSDDIGSIEFGEAVKHHIQQHYPNFRLKIWADPAANSRTQLDDNTMIKAWRKIGLPIYPCRTNQPKAVIQAVKARLNKLIGGYPALVISDKCSVLRKGMTGGFQYRRLNVSGAAKYSDKVDKNRYSHVCESLSYLINGLGDLTEITRRY